MTFAASRMIAAGFSLALVVGLASASVAASAQPQGALTAFHSDAELQAYLQRLKRRQQPPPPPAPPPMAGTADMAVASAPMESKPSAGAPGITNNQEQGVDEGDIVKQHGDVLVILRRGRLFTVSIAGGGMHPVDFINAYPPGIQAGGDWYDEMLVSADRVIVIGYSYSRGGTEINRFHIGRDGMLRFEDAYQLRSNDYYSARNYASRLIGHQLILYSPRYLNVWAENPLAALPALRRWTGDPNAPFERIGSAQEVYMSPFIPDDQIDAVHTVTSCDITADILDCKATSVLGPNGRTFYVSPRAVYIWVTPWWGNEGSGKRASSVLYRLPLDGRAPSAVGVRGGPEDQFSFREDADDGMLNVLVRASTAGDAMWVSEFSEGAVALLRLPMATFGDGMHEAEPRQYRTLPKPENGAFHNRFVGDYVLYGTGNDWGEPQGGSAELVVAPVRGGEVAQLRLPHGVDRIEVMGRDAVVVGSDEHNVVFSEIALTGRQPRAGDRYVLEGAAQAETRSHGFFYKPETADGDSGVLGLPVARPARAAYRQLFETSAALTYLRRVNGHFRPLGELDAHDEDAVDDHCVASCVDWYGNARPIFLGPRTFALMGYELVEGRLGPRAIFEKGRINFAPRGRGERPSVGQ